jgi:NarL family two-component system sensor histidine kinase LiaS
MRILDSTLVKCNNTNTTIEKLNIYKGTTRAGITMNIFRKLRWKMTFSYTLVTVSAFVVVILILGGILLPRIFVPNNILSPEVLIEILQRDTTPLWRHILSQPTVDTELVRLLMKESSGTITSADFLRIGSLQFSVRTIASMRALVIGADGNLLGISDNYVLPSSAIGQPFDINQIRGLEAPFNAALAGETNPSHLFTIFEPSNRFLLAIPVIKYTGGEAGRVLGVLVVILETIPTQGDIPIHLLNIAGRSLLLFLLSTGIMGAIFGAFIANGLASRFKKLSTTTDAWSVGDFSKFIEDKTGDEISQFAQRLNNMAKQLQSLLRRRQEMAVSEERNRLARDLHDSSKQQALAASLELGTALTLFENDPQNAKKHLLEADTLVDSVRKELTNLVHELRPQSIDGQDFSEILKEYTLDWTQRSEIESNINIEGNDGLSSETTEALFRIAQEALANVARHSSASYVDVSLEYEANTVTMIIKDNGRGFNTNEQHGGIGLNSMKERADVLGGSFTVDSVPNQGTQIVVTLPIV